MYGVLWFLKEMDFSRNCSDTETTNGRIFQSLFASKRCMAHTVKLQAFAWDA
jgi:hypothetical protein